MRLVSAFRGGWVLWIVVILAMLSTAGINRTSAQVDDGPNMVEPPAPDTPETTALLNEAAELLNSGRDDVSGILSDPRFMVLHERPSFRELIRKNATASPVVMVTIDEPGQPLRVRARLVDQNDQPLAGALVYAYQTSAKGWYSDRGAHYAANSGDMKHARLFAYVLTDESGAFELDTIRPEGYPRSDLPQHIHVHIEVGGKEVAVTEILFDDDPRLTDRNRETARRERVFIAKVERNEAGIEHCSPTIVVPRG